MNTSGDATFELTGALLSRLKLYVLKPLCAADIEALVDRALADRERGLGGLQIRFDPLLRHRLAAAADGDARRALNMLDVAAGLAPGGVIDGDLLHRGRGYRYAHDEPEGYAAGEHYFPQGLEGRRYYEPVMRGLEVQINYKLARLRALDDKARGPDGSRPLIWTNASLRSPRKAATLHTRSWWELFAGETQRRVVPPFALTATPGTNFAHRKSV